MIILILAGIIIVAGIMYIQQHKSGAKNVSEKIANEDNCLYIGTPEELSRFAERVNGGENFIGVHVMLTDDIDMSTIDLFRPIGIWRSGNYFYGVFDGMGHKITNLRVFCEEGSGNNGLFGTLGGYVCNLTIENSFFKGMACGAAASIAIDENNRVVNCAFVNNTIDALYTDEIGGQFYGRIQNCVVIHNDQNGNREIRFADSEEDITYPEEADKQIGEMNRNLEDISGSCHNVSMCKWELIDGIPSLSASEKVIPADMYIQVHNKSYTQKIYPINKDGEYTFIMPSEHIVGTTLCLKNPEKDGLIHIYEIDDSVAVKENENSGKELRLKVSDGQREYAARICYTENTSAVFVDTNTKWSMDYLKGDKFHYIYNGIIQVLDEDGSLNYKGTLEHIRGRGNDSWFLAKKGFNIELTEDGDLLGMGRDDKYALLPGYRDSSLMTYKVDQDLFKEIGLEYAPNSQFVNFYEDGEYQGLYILSEKTNIGYNRINIDPLGRKSGGYIYQLDDLDNKDDLFKVDTDAGNTYVIAEPISVSKEQLAYSKDLWNRFEEAVYSKDGYNSKGEYYGDIMDIDSLSKMWLIFEMSGEYSVSSSVFFYKDSDRMGDGKIHALYPWDVEHSYMTESSMKDDVMINVNGEGTYGLWPAMYQHEDFKKAVYENWVNLLRPGLEKLLDEKTGYDRYALSYIDTYGEKYQVSSYYNEWKWGENQNLSEKGRSIAQWLKVRMPYLDESLKVDR